MFRRIAFACLLAGAAAALPAGAQGPDPAPAPADSTPSSSVAPPATVAPPAVAAPTPAPAGPAAASAVQVAGLWCGSGPLHEFSLRLRQREQDVEGELARRGRVRTIEGRLDGNVLRTQSTKVGALVLEKRGDELKVTGGDGPLALVRGQAFRRSDSGTCTTG